MLIFKEVRDMIQRRYSLDVATTNEITSDLIKGDFKENNIKTIPQAIEFLDYLEKLGS